MGHPAQTAKTSAPTIAIIGGGVAGSTIAIRLAMAGVNVQLFEKNASLINSPPMCHLHAGGNLYREISDDDCRTLMRQCIDMAKLYPDSIDVRPTIITVPKRDSGTAEALLPRLEMLTDYYRTLVAADASNAVLGRPEDYYRVYDRVALDALAQQPQVPVPTTIDEWLIPVAKTVNLDKLQMPVIAVQEYGWNIFRLAASAQLQLAQFDHAHVLTDTRVTQLRPLPEGWQVTYHTQTAEQALQTLNVDYVINACGHRTGIIDDMADVAVKRMVEFKASYISHWQAMDGQMPEIIFHGERGTPQGMAQFTPYTAGYIQLHGMTDAITLFRDGLTHSTEHSAQPPMNPRYTHYIDEGWEHSALVERASAAIDYVSEFIPTFAAATPVDNALYGGQQVPSDDITTRVADLQVFANKRYAIAENVKANSALDVANGVIKALIEQNLLDAQSQMPPTWHRLDSTAVEALAIELAEARRYPLAMAKVNHPLQLP